jgi:CRP-like cAMP-binding protein
MNQLGNHVESAVRSAVARLLPEASSGARAVSVEAGTVVHEPHAPAEHVYLVQSGQVRIYQVGPDDTARLLEILGPGDWFGAAALAHAPVYGTRAVSVTTGTLLAAPAGEWLSRLSQIPQAAAELIAQLAAKLQAAQDDAARLVFDDCNARLIKTLLHFSRSAAATRGEDGVVLRITHQQLAQAVGAARETVSLALTHLRQKNLLRTGRNQLFFKPEALEQFTVRRPAGYAKADPANGAANGAAEDLTAPEPADEVGAAHAAHEQVA